MLYNVREGGTFVLNSKWGVEQMDAALPDSMKP